jgi:hypothetical protein
MRKNNWLINIFILLACSIFGYFVASWIEPAYMEKLWRGDSVQWMTLGSPPGGASKILSIGLELNTEDVYVSANNGKTYHCCDKKAVVWKETNLSQTTTRATCGTFVAFPSKNPPGKIIDCAEISNWEGPTNQTVFTILEDGTVWRWHNEVFFLYPLVILFIYGPVGGLITGIALILLVGRIRRASHKSR